jgi:hypothetical protein
MSNSVKVVPVHISEDTRDFKEKFGLWNKDKVQIFISGFWCVLLSRDCGSVTTSIPRSF